MPYTICPFGVLICYLSSMNDDCLYYSVVNNKQLMASMTVEQRLVASQLKIDAERHGMIHT
jgi:hypothetical protein